MYFDMKCLILLKMPSDLLRFYNFQAHIYFKFYEKEPQCYSLYFFFYTKEYMNQRNTPFCLTLMIVAAVNAVVNAVAVAVALLSFRKDVPGDLGLGQAIFLGEE